MIYLSNSSKSEKKQEKILPENPRASDSWINDHLKINLINFENFVIYQIFVDINCKTQFEKSSK